MTFNDYPAVILSIALLVTASTVAGAEESPATPPRLLRAGARAVDISPEKLPAIQNGGFLERSADRVVEPLHARALVLSDGEERIAIAIVDSCMLPRTLCDDVKARVTAEIGLAGERILIAATHTHTAPSVMDYCLGSRADPAYTKQLPPLIARAIVEAAARLEPAELGFTIVDAGDYTACRRWIRRADRPDVDPFGERTVRAMMHPGYQNPDYVGPSGPEDPWLSILAVRDLEGRPIALLGNFSMHYFGFGGGFSPDFFGRFASRVATRLAPGDGDFVGILSQGTSGDLWRGDYSRPPLSIDIDRYTGELVDLALEASRSMRYSRSVPLAMAERRVTFARRTPDAKRLEWARKVLPDRSRRPRNRPEVYALQAFFLDENPAEEVVLQALRIGDLGVTAIPCEVYALTGLELKARSPLQPTVNLSLANGAAGYIPPPEQHALGGYTTWPARTAGLEVGAEPRIVDIVVELLEEASGETRRDPLIVHGAYARGVLAERPLAYWRLEEFRGSTLADSSGHGRDATVVPRVAFHLPGPESPAFSKARRNRCLHLAGGHLEAKGLPVGRDYSVELWFWNGVRGDDRAERGTIFRRGADELRITAGDGASGSARGSLAMGERKGTTAIGSGWNHVVFTRSGDRVSAYLNGRLEIEATRAWNGAGATLAFGGGGSTAPPLEGKVDEVSVFDRALTPNDVARHFDSSGLTAPSPPPEPSGSTARGEAAEAPRPLTPPRSAEETLRATRVRRGFRLELVAAEPLVRDPVAIDWDAAGRLWVAEMVDYPSGMEGGDEPGGRIRVLEDEDRDGRYDRSTLFAEGLSFPNGVYVWRRGAIVTAAPEILYLEDADGDGRAERREALYSGFLPGNQQLRVNGLRWGLDNWIYCASGGHHAGHGAGRRVRSVKTGEEIALGSRDLRIRPAEGLLEPQSGPAQFGRVRDDWGHWFGVQNSQPLWHYVLADHYASRNPHVPAPDAKHRLRGVSPTLWPAKAPQKRYHSFEDATRFTSACGPGVYRDDLLFERSPETHVFTCDPFHGIVQHSVLARSGVTFEARVDTREGEHDFFATTDRWCRPVMARTGPDGALWIVDMYRYMIEHPDWLPPAGREELRPFYRAGDDRGRIYRVVPERGRAREIPVLAGDEPGALIERLGSSNGIVRDLAHRMIVDGKDLVPVPDLEAMALGDPRPLARLHALCALDGLGALSPRVVLGALEDPDGRVLRHAIRLAEPFGRSSEVVGATVRHARHADAGVRLQLAHTLGEWRDPRAGETLGALAVNDPRDAWIRAAILSSAPGHQEAIARRVAGGGEETLRHLASPLLALALGTESFPVVSLLVAPLVPEPRGSPRPDAWRLDALAQFLDALSAESMCLDELARKTARLDALARSVRRVLERAPVWAVEETRPEEVRRAAVSLLGRDAPERSRDRAVLAGLLAAAAPSPVELAAVNRLRQLGGDASVLLAPWASYVPEVRSAAFDALLSRAAWTKALLEAIETGAVPAPTIDASQRQRLVSLGDGDLAARARSGLGAEAVGDRAERIAAFRPAIALNGLPSRGREVFRKTCSACHSVGGIGTAVGSDLRALTDRSGEALLTAIVDPNDAVDPRYVAYSAVLRSGEVLHGLVAGETGNSLLLRLADGSERSVLRSSIRLLASSGRSFMPEGLEADLSLRDMADLLAFLERDLDGSRE